MNLGEKMTEEYPVAAFWLLLIGGILELIGAIGWAIIMGIVGVSTMMIMPIAGGMFMMCAVWFFIWDILIILSAVWVKTGDPDKVHKGATLGLISSILAGINIISLIGAILAFGWKKKAPVAVPPPPPPI